MTTREDTTGPHDDGLQNPVVHEGAPSDLHDSNEAADDKIVVLQPSGDPAPEAPSN